MKILKKIYSALVSGRQSQVDYEIARLLHSNEYRNRDFASVLTAVRNRDLGSLNL